MEKLITSNPELTNYWFGLANLILVSISISLALFIYSRYREDVRWEKNIDFGHDGTKSLVSIRLLLMDLFGKTVSSRSKINDNLEVVKIIDTYDLDPSVKQIYKRAITFQSSKQTHQTAIIIALTDIICVSMKSRDPQLIEDSNKFNILITGALNLNRQIAEKCKAYYLGDLEDPTEIYKLEEQFPKYYKDPNSILKEVYEVYNRLDEMYFKLMRS